VILQKSLSYSIVVLFVIILCNCSVQSLDEDNSNLNYIPPISDTRDVFVLSRATKICQLVGDWDRERQEPTLNQTGIRYNLDMIDLGVPFIHKGLTYILFGETWIGAYDAIAYTNDTTPEDGLQLDFIQNEDGHFRPVSIPGVSLGAFEALLEGVSIGGRMYIYVSTDNYKYGVGPGYEYSRSVLAVSDDNGYTFTYLYDLSTFPNGHFINVSIVKVEVSAWEGFPDSTGVGLVLFGSGKPAQSNVFLAFQPAELIEDPSSIWYFAGLTDSGEPTWSSQEQDAKPLFLQPCVASISVTYNRFIHKWIMLYPCLFPERPDYLRGINMRTADYPWGPWSLPTIIFHPWEDNALGSYMHVSWEYAVMDSVHDPGREYEWGIEYGSYQYGMFATGDSATTTIYFNMSTWNPYTVVLMKTILQKL